MTVISRRIIVPAQGKAEAALAQAKTLAEQATHAGTKTRLLKVIMGEDAGNLEMFVRFENFQEGVTGFQTLAASAGVFFLRFFLTEVAVLLSALSSWLRSTDNSLTLVKCTS